MADAQSIGIVAIVGAIAGAITAFGKSGWQIVSGALKLRSDTADGKVRRNVTLIEVTDRIAMGMLDRLSTENVALKSENASLRVQVADLTERVNLGEHTIIQLNGTVADLTARLERLEGKRG